MMSKADELEVEEVPTIKEPPISSVKSRDGESWQSIPPTFLQNVFSA